MEVYNQLSIKTEPFRIGFHYENESVEIKFKNGENVFKLGKAFSEFLDDNGIEHEVVEK